MLFLAALDMTVSYALRQEIRQLSYRSWPRLSLKYQRIWVLPPRNTHGSGR
jgi:hypothetical protein